MPTITDFLDEFEQASASGDAARTAALFADTFLSASADGVRALTPADLVKAIPMRKAMLAKTGVGKATLVKHEAQDLDPHYVLLNGTWGWEAHPANAAPATIELTSTFVLHRAPAGLRVVFYRSGDITGELRKRGLLTA